MTTHVIRQRDFDGPCEIRWNDETGEVSGDHGGVPRIRAWMERAERDGRIATGLGYWLMPDPRRDPACFRVLLAFALPATCFDPDALPEPLRSADFAALGFPNPAVQEAMAQGAVY